MKTTSTAKNGIYHIHAKRKANGVNGRRRANNTGTLEKRGKKWLARWYVYDADGKRIRKSRLLDAATIEEARTALRDLTEGNALMTREKEIRRNLDALDGLAAERREWEDGLPSLALSDAFAAYRKSGLRPDSGERTLSDYATFTRQLEEWLDSHRPGITEIRQLTRADAEAYAADLRATRSPNTYNKRIVFFRCLWRVLADADEGKDANARDAVDLPARLTTNPWLKIKTLIRQDHTRRELTVAELGKVCASLEGEMRILFGLGMYTGLRLADCALLEWHNIDLGRRIIQLIPRKTARQSHNKPVTIPLHPTLQYILENVPNTKRLGYVMPETAALYKHNSSMLTAKIQQHFEACGIQTKIPQGNGRRALTDVGFHSLRHTFVSLTANAGVPLAVVQAIVGHSNPAMTRHYFHENEQALRDAVMALPAIGVKYTPTPTETVARAIQAQSSAMIQEAARTPLQAFYDAYNALSDGDKAKAKEWLLAQ